MGSSDFARWRADLPILGGLSSVSGGCGARQQAQDHPLRVCRLPDGGWDRSGVSSSAGRESYFWGGVSVKVRAYNAFLQGQFRESDHELDASDLNILLAEVWAGYTHSVWNDVELSYVLRAQISEIKGGQGDRTLIWGGLVLSKRFGSF